MVTRKTKTAVAASSDRSEVTVSWRGKSRTYSLVLHGEHFETLAKEFAAKVGGIVG